MSEDTNGEEPQEHDEEPPESAVAEERSAPKEPTTEEERAPLSSLRDRLEARDTATGHGEAVDPDSPLSELAAEASPSSEAEESDLFEKVDVGDVDSQAVWDAVVDADGTSQDILGEPAEPAAGAEPARKPAEHVIDKREYCQRCEYFTAPPTVACTHEGTDIVELVDDERFMVRNCPKVKDDEAELQTLVEDEQP
jgi:hypothetical protein